MLCPLGAWQGPMLRVVWDRVAWQACSGSAGVGRKSGTCWRTGEGPSVAHLGLAFEALPDPGVRVASQSPGPTGCWARQVPIVAADWLRGFSGEVLRWSRHPGWGRVKVAEGPQAERLWCLRPHPSCPRQVREGLPAQLALHWQLPYPVPPAACEGPILLPAPGQGEAPSLSPTPTPGSCAASAGHQPQFPTG